MPVIILFKVSYLFAFFVGVIAVVGDLLGGKRSTPWGTAFVDNLTHALIACFTWMCVSTAKAPIVRSEVPKEAILCGLFASLIDLDHFVSAASWRLSVTTFQQTPYFCPIQICWPKTRCKGLSQLGGSHCKTWSNHLKWILLVTTHFSLRRVLGQNIY